VTSISLTAGETKTVYMYRKVGSKIEQYTKGEDFSSYEIGGITIESGENGSIKIYVPDTVTAGTYTIVNHNTKTFPAGSHNTISIAIQVISSVAYDNNLHTLSLQPGEKKDISINVKDYIGNPNTLIKNNKIVVLDSSGNKAEGVTIVPHNTFDTTVEVNSSVKRGNVYYIVYNSSTFEEKNGIKIVIKENESVIKKVKTEYANKNPSKLAVSASKTGIKITWKNSFTNKPTGYQLARSTSKSSGFKTIYDGNDLVFQNKYNITKGKIYYYKVRAYYDLGEKKIYSKWTSLKSVKAISSLTASDCMYEYILGFDDHILLDNSEVFVDKEIKWVKNITSEEEFWNNVTYSYLVGNYNLNFIFKNEKDAILYQQILKKDFRNYIFANNSFMGAFTNAITKASFNVEKYAESWYKLSITIDGICLTNEEIFQREKEAFSMAEKIVKAMHESGKITDSMNETQIVSAYNQYLMSYGVLYGSGSKDNHLTCPPYDDAYSSLVSKVAACGGKAAGFNILMGIEGIKAVGLGVHGHIATLIIVDGVELANDWGNNYPLIKLNDYNKVYPEVSESLQISRKILNNK